jgi:hypothetical protein
VGDAAVFSLILFGLAAVLAHTAWRFAFHYQEELAVHPVGRGAGYHFLLLQDHGYFGVVTGIGGALISCLFAARWAWRAWSAYPAAIIMPDRLWLHPSFGRQPIPFANIIGVRLDRVGNGRFRGVALIVDLDRPAKRNRVFWAWSRDTNTWVVSETSIDCTLWGLARFRNALVEQIKASRRKTQASVK